MIKLLFCTDGVFPHSVGGMQRHSRLLVEELAKNEDLEVTILHPHKASIFSSPRVKEILIDPINLERNYLIECYNYSKRVYKIIKERPDHIIYSQGLSVWYGVKEFSDRLVINPHGLEPYQALGLKHSIVAIPFKLVFNYLFKHSRSVISLGGKLTGILKQNIEDIRKIVEIPNGVTIPTAIRRLKTFDSPIKVLFIGRFASNKGISILFKTIANLNKRGFHDHFYFTIAGNGPLYRFFCNNNNYDNVTLPGSITDEEMKQLYMSSSIFVLPTLFEGMPTVVLEAMSFGLPVIVSDVGATSLLVDDMNGKLIKPKSEEELTNALLWFMNLADCEKQKMSDSSYNKIIASYTWQKVCKDHIELFETIALAPNAG